MPDNLTSQIQMDEELDVSYERVDKLDAPLLLIGLGGTGADAVRTVKATLARRFNLPKANDGKVIPIPRRTGYLVIDSDATAKSGLDDNEIVNIASGVSLNAMLKDPLHVNLTTQQKQWIHRDLHAVGADGSIGAGTYRAASRLMLDCKFDEVYQHIHLALKNLVTMKAGGAGMNGAAQIFVITGIGGGTGSGTFLDIGQIIRHMMASEADLLGMTYNLSAYIVMPDLTLSHLLEEGATTMNDLVKRNSYAALKELDFWMDYNRHHTEYVMTYSNGTKIRWRDPFDHVTLMSGTNVEGRVFEGAYKLVQRTIAENLLHYMADENPGTSAEGTAQFTFLSYESNLHAQTQYCRDRMTLPLNHVYRAVGAYSKRIPKKKILYYEGRVLFKTFIPPRDDHGVIKPKDELLKDGKANQRFAAVAGPSFKTLYNDFSNLAPMPKNCHDFSASDADLVRSMRSTQIRPHESYAAWQRDSIAPQARKYAENYLNATWDRFATLCKNIMSDPAYGPFALKLYLEDPSVSLRVAFKNYASRAQSSCTNLFNSINESKAACGGLYNDFLRPPVMNFGHKAEQAYLDALRNLLDTVRQYELARQYAQVMDLLCKRIDAYITNALNPLCDLLVSLEKEFGDTRNSADPLGSDLFDVATLHGDIDSTFLEANKENKISRSFLGKLCDSTFETEKNVDAGSCGLTFLFRRNAQLKAMSLMKEEMDACCQGINGQSLDSIMTLQIKSEDAAQRAEEQKKYINEIATGVVRSATPLFSLSNAGSKTEITSHTAKQLYFSVPRNAPAFLNQLTPGPGAGAVKVEGVELTPKASSLTDHLFCNMTWDVLPLYSYSQLDSIKKAYDNAFKADNSAAYALHLVWTGDSDGDYTQNWCKLPAPAPFYFFTSDADSIRDKEEYERTRKLVDRALDCGMLTISSTEEHPVEFPKYTFRVFRDVAGAQHNETIAAKLKAILGRKDPVTGAPASPDALLSALNELVKSAEPSEVAAGKSPTVMKNKLGIDESKTPINPFIINNNPDQLREANRYYYMLTVEYAVHILLQNPSLMRDVQYQIESFEQIGAAIHSLVGQTKRWEPRIAYAQTFGKLYAFGLVRFDMMGNPVFNDDAGNVAPLIQPAIFHEDLKDCERVVKAVGVLADLDTQHAIRQTLEFRLSVAEKNWDDAALHSALTPEEISAQIARLQELADESAGERKAYASKKTNDMNADHALLDKYLALLAGVESYVSSRLALLRRIAQPTSPAPVPTSAPATAPASAPVSVRADDTWDCACGEKGLTGKFCPACGAPRPVKASADTWDCACGEKGLTGKFCPACGSPRLVKASADTWDCACGEKGLTGKFCPACGSPRPVKAPADTWDCACGKKGLTGKFCPTCGSKKPE